MSPEERQLLTDLFTRVHTAASTPRDPEAENLIVDAVRAEPAAPYYLAQAVIVQEKGLEAASKRIAELEAQNAELRLANGTRREPEQRGGFLSSIFGSGQTAQSAAQPSPQSAPRPYNGAPSGPWGQSVEPNPGQSAYGQQQPGTMAPAGPWSQNMRSPSAGGSFLTGALGTAAGVAGGMLLANSLSGIFSHHMSGLGLGSPLSEGLAPAPVEETTVINNYYGVTADEQTAQDPTQPEAAPEPSQDSGFQQADFDDGNSDWNADDGNDGGDGSSFA